MSELEKYKLNYQKARWVKLNTKANQAKAQKAEKIEKDNNKENKKMKTSKIETVKTIVITALVTGIIAFIAGTVYAGGLHDKVKAEAANIVKNIKVEAQIQPQPSKQ